MKVISVIEDEEVVRKILKHLDLCEVKPRPPSKTAGPPKVPEYAIDDSTPKVLVSDDWLYVDPVYLEIVPSWVCIFCLFHLQNSCKIPV
jgi:hypothetical protein